MKRSPQGERWRRLDNTAKIFPVIASENLSNVFRIAAVLKEEVDPGTSKGTGRNPSPVRGIFSEAEEGIFLVLF
uniref:hypothetical protein n=1 Tax=Clostridium sp. NkU-1 TaxID=1095009 RepID=UPI000AAB9D60